MSSDPNLTLRLLRELSRKLDAFREETREEFQNVYARLDRLDHTVSGMAAHVFAMTGTVKDHERRIRKLEGRSSK